MKADLAKLRALHEAATPGEWSWEMYAPRIFKVRGEMLPRGGQRRCVATLATTTIYENSTLDEQNRASAELIAAMHEALPELLAIAEAVERAPVFAADLFSQDGRIVGVDLNKHGAERVRILAIGEDGNG